MSRFDENPESRTVANSPLQQSSFVFFPEEGSIRRMIETHPDVFRDTADRALNEQDEKNQSDAGFLRARQTACAGYATELAKDAGQFAGSLPQTLFGTGDGAAYLLPVGLFFERVEQRKRRWGDILTDLDRFWETDGFDPHRFLFAAEVLRDPALAGRIRDVAERRDVIRGEAQRLSKEIGDFTETVIDAFFQRAGQAVDLNGSGAGMRFGTLIKLCGELRHAAESFAKRCRENTANEKAT